MSGVKSVETITYVTEEARLAHFPVGDNVDARLDLLAHDIGDGLGDLPVEQFLVVWPPVLLLLHRVEERMGTSQAADVGGQYALHTPLHCRLRSSVRATANVAAVPR